MTVCSGNGNCATASGTCVCYKGYGGAACTSCLAEYVRVSSSGPCVYLPGAFATCTDGIKDGNELGVDCGGPNCPNACKAGANLTPLIIKVSILSVLGALVVSVAYFFVCKKRLVSLPKVVSTHAIKVAAEATMVSSHIMPVDGYGKGASAGGKGGKAATGTRSSVSESVHSEGRGRTSASSVVPWSAVGQGAAPGPQVGSSRKPRAST